MIKCVISRVFAVFGVICLLCSMIPGVPVFAAETEGTVSIQVAVPEGFQQHVIVYVEKTDNFEENYAARVTASKGYVDKLTIPSGKYHVSAFLENGDYRYNVTPLNGVTEIDVSGSEIQLDLEVKFNEAYSEGATLPPEAETEAAATENGFVFLQADVPPSFSETVEVTLTEMLTEETYTFDLYAINNYMGNFKVPFGLYFLSADVTSKIMDVDHYAATCDPEEIEIKNAQLAVGVVIDVGLDPGIEKEETKATETKKETVKTSIAEEVEWVTGRSGWSIVGSAITSVVVILLVAGVLFYFKNKN